MRELLLNISLVAVASALFKMLVPESGFKKQAGFLVACFFLTSVAGLITNADFSEEIEPFISFEAGGFIDFSSQTTNERKRAIGEELSSRVKDLLAKNEIYPSKIYVIVNISGIYSISISEIRLVLPPESDFLKAAKLVESEVGEEVKVVFLANLVDI